MKKFLYTALLISVIAGCGDNSSNSSSGSGSGSGTTPTPPTEETIVISNETEVGKTSNNTITLKNPQNVKANIYINMTFTDQQKLNIINTTCGTLSSNYINGTLEAGQECIVEYTFTPTNLTTDVLFINVDYIKDKTALCNNLTLDNIKTNYINNKVKVINYAKDTNGNKSPELSDIVFVSDYFLAGGYKTYTATKSIVFTSGTYTISDKYNNITITSSGNNCQISDNTLSVFSNSPCNLEFTMNTNTSYDTYVKFMSNKKNYTAFITFDTKWFYEQITTSSTILVQYINGLPEQNITQIINITKPIDYQLQGTNADKFKVVPATYNGCTVTASNINLPAGKSSCYVEVDFTDLAKQTDGSYTAQLNLPATASVYNISGDVVNDAVKYFQDNLCSQLQP